MDKQLYKEAEKLLEKEIRETVDKGSLDMQSLDIMYKVLDNIKDISIICAMKKELEEGEYSERRASYDDESYARGRGRYARRDSMGRYSSRDSYEGSYDGSYDGSYGEGGSYGRSSYERGYSREEDFERLLRDATSEKERSLIRQLMEAKQNK